MSYTGFGAQGGTSLCYPFYERMVACIRGEVLPLKMCSFEAEDFLECHERTKSHILNYKVQEELHKLKLLSIPQYDEENDRFIIDPSVTNADSLFEKK